MKKLILIPILIILSTINCLALDSSIWYQFPVPEYSYSHAYLTVPNIFRWQIHGVENQIVIYCGIHMDFFSQNKDLDYWYRGVLNGAWHKRKYHSGGQDQIYESKEAKYSDYFGATKYFDSFNIWGTGSLNINARNEYECRTILDLEIGVGIGRIVYCTSVAKAIRLVKELDIRADENLILEIADIIGKQSEYTTKYKDDWEEVFYQKIADMVGLLEQGLKVRRILSSSIYEMNSRARGWELKLGYENMYFTGIEPELKGRITLHAEYQLPWELNKQIYFIADYSRDLDDDRSNLYIAGRFGIDHSYTWASFIGINADKTFNTPSGNKNASYGITVGTEKNIFDRLVSNFGLSFDKKAYSSDPYFDMWLELKYYLW